MILTIPGQGEAQCCIHEGILGAKDILGTCERRVFAQSASMAKDEVLSAGYGTNRVDCAATVVQKWTGFSQAFFSSAKLAENILLHQALLLGHDVMDICLEKQKLQSRRRYGLMTAGSAARAANGNFATLCDGLPDAFFDYGEGTKKEVASW